MRWLTIHIWSLICISSLCFTGCAVNHGAHFSVAPELDFKKIDAISNSVAIRTQPASKKTIKTIKSDQITVTGFKKPENKKPVLRQKEHNVHYADAGQSNTVLEIDEFADFHQIELVESNRSIQPKLSMQIESPLVAKKPEITHSVSAVVPEITSVVDVAFRTNSEIQVENKIPVESPPVELENTKTDTSPQTVDLGLKPLTQLTLKIKPSAGDLPPNTAEEHLKKIPVQHVVMGDSRDWNLVTKEWEAPGVSYFPLYFEEPNLERYGYNYGALQPFVSAGRFFGRIPALPYMLGAYPPDECMYPLGYERPGSCPPYQVERFPFSWRGSVYSGLTATGLVFLIP